MRIQWKIVVCPSLLYNLTSAKCMQVYGLCVYRTTWTKQLYILLIQMSTSGPDWPNLSVADIEKSGENDYRCKLHTANHLSISTLNGTEAVGASRSADGVFLLDAAAVRAVLRADSHRFRTSQVHVAGRACRALARCRRCRWRSRPLLN